MTVKQLRAYLETFPEDMVVSINGYEGGVTDNFFMQEKDVILNFHDVTDNIYFGEHEVMDEYFGIIPNTKEVVKRLIIG